MRAPIVLLAALAILSATRFAAADRLHRVTDGEPGAKPPIHVPAEPSGRACDIRFTESLDDAIRTARTARLPLLVYLTWANNRGGIEPEMREAFNVLGRFPKRFLAVVGYLEGNESAPDRLARAMQVKALPVISILEFPPDGSIVEKMRIVGVQTVAQLRALLASEFGSPDTTGCPDAAVRDRTPPRPVPAQCRIAWRRDAAGVLAEAAKDGRKVVAVVDGRAAAACPDCDTLRALLAGGALASFGGSHHAVWIDSAGAATTHALEPVVRAAASDRTPALLVFTVSPQGVISGVQRMPRPPAAISANAIVTWLGSALEVTGTTPPDCIDALVLNRF